MQNLDYETASDVALLHEHFQNFLEAYTKSGGTFLPEVTEHLLDAYGVGDRKSIMAIMVYAFAAGLNTGIGLATAEDETKNKEG